MRIQITKLPRNIKALGGVVQTHGSDFSTGLVTIGAGGTHEENPYDGVQLGQDSFSVPNLVEEGETVYNDYVFSNRILADEATKKLFHLPKKKDITFADISKRLEKEISERPNDPISRSGFEAQMQTLEEQQERQKSEMEAERARAAFEALSPEEQTALMQQKAQQEAMAQQAAVQEAEAQQQAQQSAPEEVAMMQQQADGTEANVGQAPMMAEGGNLYAGGSKLNPYAYSKTWDGFDYFDPVKNTYDEGYLNFVKGINQDWVDRILKGQYGSMDRYLAKNKGVALTPEQVVALATDKKYSDMHKAVASAYKEYLAGIDPKTGKPIEQASVPEKIGQVYIADDNGVHPVDESSLDDSYTIEDFDGVKIARKKPGEASTSEQKAGEAAKAKEEQMKNVKPKYKHTMFGIEDLGPFAALTMQGLGIGRGDTSGLETAANSAGNYTTASWMPRGDFMKLRLTDPWRYTMPILASSRATDRALMNSSSPSRMAGLLANGYNTQIALGEAALKGDDVNWQRYVAKKTHDADVYRSNQGEYGQTSRFNANAHNDASQRSAQLRYNAAQAKMAADNDWYRSLYANVGNIFDNFGRHRKENDTYNMIADMAANSLFGVMTPDNSVATKYLKWDTQSAEGGKIKRKRNKKRGLTF